MIHVYFYSVLPYVMAIDDVILAKLTSQMLRSSKGRNSVETLAIQKNAITTFFGIGRGIKNIQSA